MFTLYRFKDGVGTLAFSSTVGVIEPSLGQGPSSVGQPRLLSHTLTPAPPQNLGSEITW